MLALRKVEWPESFPVIISILSTSPSFPGMQSKELRRNREATKITINIDNGKEGKNYLFMSYNSKGINLFVIYVVIF